MRKAAFSSAELTKLSELASRAKSILLNENLHKVEFHDTPVLLVGATYPGAWLEHNQDALLLARLVPEARDIAWATVEVFLKRQRDDGLMPFCIPKTYAPDAYFNADALYWQVQSVFPFVRCAVEIAQMAKRPDADFERIYEAGCRYDAWFRRFRDRAGTGLVEMFCEYDTGHDDSPRVTDGGLPHSCPGDDAVNMPNLPCMPIQAADLSATEGRQLRLRYNADGFISFA